MYKGKILIHSKFIDETAETKLAENEAVIRLYKSGNMYIGTVNEELPENKMYIDTNIARYNAYVR